MGQSEPLDGGKSPRRRRLRAANRNADAALLRALLHELFRHSDKVAASCATGGLRVLTDNSGDGVVMSPEGVVLKLLQTHFSTLFRLRSTGIRPSR